VNANTGDIAWRATAGITDELPEGKKNTGRTGMAGPIVTAGGLVFLGATNDNRFRAFDSHTGRELWSVQLDYEAHAIPMTYQENGKQYVAIMSSGAPSPGATANGQALLVYALP
jgi:quinoprotein glucose dehydrogenase